MRKLTLNPASSLRLNVAIGMISALLLAGCGTQSSTGKNTAAVQATQTVMTTMQPTMGQATQTVAGTLLPTAEATRDYYATPTPYPYGTPPDVITAYVPVGNPTYPAIATIPPAPTLFPITNTIIIQDSFITDTSSNYTVVGFDGEPSYHWGVHSGTFYADDNNGGGSMANGSIAVVGRDNWSDYTVEVQTYPSYAPVGVIVRYSVDGFYLFRVGRKWELERVTNVSAGIYSVIASGELDSGFIPNQWNRMSIKAQGSTITASLNGTQVASISDYIYQSGKAGLFAEDILAPFANLRITSN